MSQWDKFKNNYLGKISNIVSWIFNIAGLILAVLSFIKNDTDLGWGVVLSVIIFNSIFLIIVSIYETLLYKRGSSIEDNIIKKNKEEIDQLSLRLASNIHQSEKLLYYYKYIISTLNNFSTQLLGVNYKLQQTYADISRMENEYTNKNSETDDAFDTFILGLKNNADEEYRRSMLKQFNHFLSNVTNKLKFILDILLHEKGCLLDTSISVKQFNRIVTDIQNINDVYVITTFRDSQTYSQGKREIGENRYTINGNTDFLYCLSHPYFLKNNIKSNDRTYDNEHKGFLDFYNCTIVVPIKCQYPASSHIYGYLTCDILNNDLSKDNLLDDRMAEIMEATANIMGNYFDSMDFQWEYILENDFLDIIFNMKSNSIH